MIVYVITVNMGDGDIFVTVCGTEQKAMDYCAEMERQLGANYYSWKKCEVE